ncbi:hypothetical protein ACFQ60_00250 [Streptomyces zhihengii]
MRTIDLHGGSDAVVHTYQYTDGGAWHYNEDPFTPEDERTWSTWRGYEKVTHLTGQTGYPDRPQLKTVTVYLRGMHGDRILGPDGKTPDPTKRKTTTVTGIAAPVTNDYERYAGQTRETVTYNGTTEVGGIVTDLWTKRPPLSTSPTPTPRRTWFATQQSPHAPQSPVAAPQNPHAHHQAHL